MLGYSAITIIYNPHATGSGKTLAYQLERRLAQHMPETEVRIIPTKHSGHAEALAYRLAKATSRPLIISSSGDGGYHEVVNGIVKAQHEGATPVVGLLPAGNANDHYRSLHESDDMAEAIQKGKIRTVDLLKLTYQHNGKPCERYAHSYIGLGLTPKAGRELNSRRYNPLVEAWIVLKTIMLLRPVYLQVQGKIQAYDSLVFSNVPRMSKLFLLSAAASVDDGKFEITAFRRHNKLHLLRRIFTALTRGLQGKSQATEFSFEATQPTSVQLDGEIITLDPHTLTRVTIVPAALPCII